MTEIEFRKKGWKPAEWAQKRGSQTVEKVLAKVYQQTLIASNDVHDAYEAELKALQRRGFEILVEIRNVKVKQ